MINRNNHRRSPTLLIEPDGIFRVNQEVSDVESAAAAESELLPQQHQRSDPKSWWSCRNSARCAARKSLATGSLADACRPIRWFDCHSSKFEAPVPGYFLTIQLNISQQLFLATASPATPSLFG
jgi:hypothetical protein